MATVTRGLIQRGDLANWDGKTATSTRLDATGGTITGLAIGNEVDILQVYGQGSSRTRASIVNAVEQIASASVTAVFAPGTWTIDDNLTIPSNITCHVPAGCVFSVAAGKTLTFSGPVYRQSETWTSGAGSVSSGKNVIGYIERTSGETSAGVTPTNYKYFPGEQHDGDLRRLNFVFSLGSDDGPYLQNAIDAAPIGGVATIPATKALYTETAIEITKSLWLRGNAKRSCSIIWAGNDAGAVMITTGTPAQTDNIRFSDFEIGNIGTCDIGLLILTTRARIERIFSNATEGFETAVIQSGDSSNYAFQNVLRDVSLFVSAAGKETPYGFYVTGGHTIDLSHSMFSGFSSACVRVGSVGQSVKGFTATACRVESFSGQSASYPGGATAIGYHIINGDCIEIAGGSMEMDADGDASAAAQRAVTLVICNSGRIGGVFMSGTGQCTGLIDVSANTAEGLVIAGNCFHNVFGYGVVASGSGSLADHEIGINKITGGTTGSFNNAFTPGITFGGAAVGLTYSSRSGTYQRVGDTIRFQISIALSAKGSSTGTVRITGLPIVSNSASNSFSINLDAMASMSGHVYVAMDSGASLLRIHHHQTGTSAELTDANFTDTTTLTINGTYQVATP